MVAAMAAAAVVATAAVEVAVGAAAARAVAVAAMAAAVAAMVAATAGRAHSHRRPCASQAASCVPPSIRRREDRAIGRRPAVFLWLIVAPVGVRRQLGQVHPTCHRTTAIRSTRGRTRQSTRRDPPLVPRTRHRHSDGRRLCAAAWLGSSRKTSAPRGRLRYRFVH